MFILHGSNSVSHIYIYILAPGQAWAWVWSGVGLGWVEGYCRPGAVVWPWDRSGPGVYKCPSCLLVWWVMWRRSGVDVALDSVLRCALCHTDKSAENKNKHLGALRDLPLFNTHTHSIHKKIDLFSVCVCLQTGFCGTNCVLAQSEASVWLWGVGEDGSLGAERPCYVFVS